MPRHSKERSQPNRLVLDGVPWVGFYKGGDRCPEDIAFPSCLRACLEYLGDSAGCEKLHADARGPFVNCAYAYLLGTSGAAFFLSWRPGWHGDNVALHYMSADPAAPYRRAFESVGYGYEIIHKTPSSDCEGLFLRCIMQRIAQGRPVLGFGVVGPLETCIITGYDEGGDVLLGWSYFQHFPAFAAGVEFEPSGYFRKRGWFGDTEALIAIGHRERTPDPEQVDREALRWGLRVARATRVDAYGHERWVGIAAYQAWADHLLMDEQFPAGDLAALMQRIEVHQDAVGTVAEARWYGHLFLKEMAARRPAMSEELLAAADCCRAEHDLMWRVWGLIGESDRGEPQARKLADPTVRRQTAPIILQARDHDARAAERIASALQR